MHSLLVLYLFQCYLFPFFLFPQTGMISVGLDMNSWGFKFPIFIYSRWLVGFMLAVWWISKALIADLFITHVYDGGRFSTTSKTTARHVGIALVISKLASHFATWLTKMVVASLVTVPRKLTWPKSVFKESKVYSCYRCSLRDYIVNVAVTC